MNQADYLSYVKFNKAEGSGEYDLPNDMLRGFAGSGLEANVQIVPVPSLAAELLMLFPHLNLSLSTDFLLN